MGMPLPVGGLGLSPICVWYSMRQIKVGAAHYGVNVLRSDRKKLRSERNYLVKYYVPLRS